MVREQAARPGGGAGAARRRSSRCRPRSQERALKEMAEPQRLRAGGGHRAPDLGRRGPGLGQRAGAARGDPRGRPQPLLSRRAGHHARRSATSGRSPRPTSPSSRTPTRCCRSRASRSARPGSRPKLEADLRGHAGTQKIEVSAAGRVMRELGRVEGTAGKDLELTLDLALQSYAMQRMAGQSAAAAVIDVTNGDIVALASAPGFDPNSFVFGISSPRVEGAARRRLPPARQQDDHRHLPARLDLQGLHGAGRARGRRRQPRRRRATAPASTSLGKRALPLLEARRPRPGRHAPQPRPVLRLLLLRDGPPPRPRPDQRDGAPARARRRATTCRCPAVSAGNMPDAAWKKVKRKEPWTTGDSFNYGIGQGFTLASPLQLAVMMARVASGTAVKPRHRRARSTACAVPVDAGRAARQSPTRTCTRCATACTRSRTRAPPSARASSIRR